MMVQQFGHMDPSFVTDLLQEPPLAPDVPLPAAWKLNPDTGTLDSAHLAGLGQFLNCEGDWQTLPRLGSFTAEPWQQWPSAAAGFPPLPWASPLHINPFWSTLPVDGQGGGSMLRRLRMDQWGATGLSPVAPAQGSVARDFEILGLVRNEPAEKDPWTRERAPKKMAKKKLEMQAVARKSLAKKDLIIPGLACEKPAKLEDPRFLALPRMEPAEKDCDILELITKASADEDPAAKGLSSENEGDSDCGSHPQNLTRRGQLQTSRPDFWRSFSSEDCARCALTQLIYRECSFVRVTGHALVLSEPPESDLEAAAVPKSKKKWRHPACYRIFIRGLPWTRRARWLQAFHRLFLVIFRRAGHRCRLASGGLIAAIDVDKTVLVRVDFSCSRECPGALCS